MIDTHVTVQEVTLTPGSTIATGVGVTDDGTIIEFAADWRPMRDIERALAQGELVETDLPGWAITARHKDS